MSGMVYSISGTNCDGIGWVEVVECDDPIAWIEANVEDGVVHEVVQETQPS